MVKALDISIGGSQRKRKKESTEGYLPVYLVFSNINSFIGNELRSGALEPIIYRQSGGIAHGLDATMLPKICDIWLNARDAGVLTENQKEIAKKADLLMRGLAHVGIIALVDRDASTS